MENISDLSPPEQGGIFLSEYEREYLGGLLGGFAAICRESSRAQNKLDEILPIDYEKEDPLEELGKYNRLIKDYCKIIASPHRQKTEVVLNILLPGKENRHVRVKSLHALFGDSREVSPEFKKDVKEMLNSCDQDELLRGAGIAIDYEPPNPLIEMRISYTEYLKEKAAQEADSTAVIRQTSEKYRTRIVDELILNRKVEVILGEEKFFLSSNLNNQSYLTRFNEDGMTIHYYDGQLQSYESQRNAGINDEIFFLDCILRHQNS